MRTHLGTDVDICPSFRYFLQTGATADVCMFRLRCRFEAAPRYLPETPLPSPTLPKQLHMRGRCSTQCSHVDPHKSGLSARLQPAQACKGIPISTYATAARLSVHIYAYFCIAKPEVERKQSATRCHMHFDLKFSMSGSRLRHCMHIHSRVDSDYRKLRSESVQMRGHGAHVWIELSYASSKEPRTQHVHAGIVEGVLARTGYTHH